MAFDTTNTQCQQIVIFRIGKRSKEDVRIVNITGVHVTK